MTNLTNISELKSEINPQLLLIDCIDNLPVAVYACDHLGYITAFNKAAVKLWGRVPVIGEDLWCGSWKIFKLNGDSLPLDQSSMAKVLKEGKSLKGELIIIEQPDGKRFQVQPNIEPLFDENENLIGAINTLIDVSHLNNADKSQSILAAIVDTSDDTIISKTLNGVINSWNNAAFRMFGYTADEAIGKHISLIIPKDRLKEEEYIIGQIAKGNKVDHFETIRVAKNGKFISISLSISPIKDSSGKIIGASKIARDITQQKLAQEALEMYTKNIEAISKENSRLYEEVKILNSKKDEFIGLASHELKTPLTSILGYLQLLNRLDHQQPQHSKFISKTLHQARRLSVLVSDLLDVSKIESGKLQMNMGKLNIKNLLDETIELIQENNEKYEIILETPFQELEMTGDAQRIEQVIINLLTNAIKYSPGTNKTEVSLQSSSKTVNISIKDYGMGIPEDKLKGIFSRFYRVDDLNPHISGLGIGLYISKEIVIRHNGKIWAESKLGEGSVFNVELPIEACNSIV